MEQVQNRNRSLVLKSTKSMRLKFSYSFIFRCIDFHIFINLLAFRAAAECSKFLISSPLIKWIIHFSINLLFYIDYFWMIFRTFKG